MKDQDSKQNIERGKDDDGRVVANMNVEGMPWYDKFAPKIKGKKQEKTVPPMTKEEYRRLMADMLWGIIPVAAIFIGVFALLIFLMTEFW